MQQFHLGFTFQTCSQTVENLGKKIYICSLQQIIVN